MGLLPKVPQMQRSVNGFRLNHTKSGVRFQRRESGNRKNAAWQDARRASKPRVILLDTNVVSEPMRPKPDRNVLAWLDAQVGESLYLSTVSLAELLLGIESLPSDKRAKSLPRPSVNRLSPCSASGSFRSISVQKQGEIPVDIPRHRPSVLARYRATPRNVT